MASVLIFTGIFSIFSIITERVQYQEKGTIWYWYQNGHQFKWEYYPTQHRLLHHYFIVESLPTSSLSEFFGRLFKSVLSIDIFQFSTS